MEKDTINLLDLAQKTLSGQDTTTFKKIYGIGASPNEIAFAKDFSFTCNSLITEKFKTDASYENIRGYFNKLASIYSQFNDSDFALAISHFKDLANYEVEGMYDKLFFTMLSSFFENNPCVNPKGHVVNSMMTQFLEKKEEPSVTPRITIK